MDMTGSYVTGLAEDTDLSAHSGDAAVTDKWHSRIAPNWYAWGMVVAALAILWLLRFAL